MSLIATAKTVAAQSASLPSGYRVRPVNRLDENALAVLYRRAYPVDIVADLQAAEEEMRATYPGQYGPLRFDLSPVVVTGRRLVGAAMTVVPAPWYDTPPGLFLIEVITEPTCRRRGVARAAMIWAAQRMVVAGFATVALRVETDNEPAVAH